MNDFGTAPVTLGASKIKSKISRMSFVPSLKSLSAVKKVKNKKV